MSEIRYQVSREIADYTHRQSVIAEMKKQNLYVPAPVDLPLGLQDSGGDFVMPRNITEIHSHDLGQLLAAITSLLQWYGSVLASARIDKLTAERVKNFTEAKVRMTILSDEQMKKDFKAREDKDAFVNMDDLVQQAQDWFDAKESVVIMAEQLYKDMERNYSLVSREITRRGSDFGREGRETNLR